MFQEIFEKIFEHLNIDMLNIFLLHDMFEHIAEVLPDSGLAHNER